MIAKIVKLKTEREKNRDKISELQARNKELDGEITELENTDIVGMVRELGPVSYTHLDTKQQLDNILLQASSIAQQHNCLLTRLDFRQEEGLMSSLPLACNQVEIERGLTTSSTAIFVPFTTQELFQLGKEALYCGLNALSNNLIMVDRKLLKNPNGLILGTPGSGKSFSAKREIANVFLVTDDDIIICRCV